MNREFIDLIQFDMGKIFSRAHLTLQGKACGLWLNKTINRPGGNPVQRPLDSVISIWVQLYK